MIQIYWEGMLLLGIPAMFFVGPVLLTLLQASLKFGFRAGFAVALGISFSDVVCVVLCYVGLSRFLTQPESKFVLGVVGGILLVGFGATSLIKTPKPIEEEIELKGGDFLSLFTKGFLVNFVNPFVFGYWIMAIGLATARHGGSAMNISLFFAGSITVIFVTDALKAYLAERVKPLLGATFFKMLNKGVGLALVGIGIYFVYQAFYPKK